MRKQLLTTGIICLTLLLVNTCVDSPAGSYNPYLSCKYSFLERDKLQRLSNDLFELQRKYEYLEEKTEKVSKELSNLETEYHLQQFDFDNLSKKVVAIESLLK